MQIFVCVRGSDLEALMLDFILGYIQSRLSARRRISKHPKSAGCAGHTLFAKHVYVVFYNAVESFEMLHKLQKPICEIRFFGLLAAAIPFSDSVRRADTIHRREPYMHVGPTPPRCRPIVTPT